MLYYFGLFKQSLFSMSNSHFQSSKMTSNKLKYYYLNVLNMEIDFCSPMLYFSLLIQTFMECIKKKLLVEVNWFNKANLK